MLRARQLVATGGPDGQSSWLDIGVSVPVQLAAAVGTTATLVPIKAVPASAKVISGSVSVADFVPSGAAIEQLNGASISLAANLAAQTTLNIQLSVYRTVGTMSGAGGAAMTSIPLTNPLNTALPSGATLTITNPGGTSTTVTTSAAVGLGATSIPVNSVNLTGYASGSPLVWQLGGTWVLGWSTVGTGTPNLTARTPTALPWNQANNAQIQGGAAGPNFIQLQPTDHLEVAYSTSVGTVTVPNHVLTTTEN